MTKRKVYPDDQNFSFLQTAEERTDSVHTRAAATRNVFIALLQSQALASANDVVSSKMKRFKAKRRWNDGAKLSQGCPPQPVEKKKSWRHMRYRCAGERPGRLGR